MVGYPLAIRELLLEWGGLTVCSGDYVFFEPFGGEWEEYEEELGRKLYSIGITQDSWDVCVDEQGAVYVILEWKIKVGSTFEAGMTYLLTGKKPS